MSKLNLATTLILFATLIMVLFNSSATTLSLADVEKVCIGAEKSAECSNISNAFVSQESKQFWLKSGVAFANIINLVFIAIKIGIKQSNQNRVTNFTKFTDLFLVTVDEDLEGGIAGTFSIYTNKAFKPSTISLSELHKYGVVPTAEGRGVYKHQHIYEKRNVNGQLKLVHVKSI